MNTNWTPTTVLLVVSMIATIAAGIGLPANAGEQKSFLDAEAIFAGWESTYGGIRTMRVSYSSTLEDYRESPDNPGILEGTTIGMTLNVQRVEEGRRYHLRTCWGNDAFERPEAFDEQAFDGKVSREYFANSRSGSIVPGLMNKGGPNSNLVAVYMHLNVQPVSRNLKDKYPDGLPMFAALFKQLSDTAVVRPELESVAGQLCHVLELFSMNKQGKETARGVFWLAHEKGMCLLKYEEHRDNVMVEQIVVDEIAEAKTDTTSIWYPAKARRTTNTKELGTITHKLTTREFVPNIEVNDDTFRFDFPPGTHVADSVSGLQYHVAGAGPDGSVKGVYEFGPGTGKPTRAQMLQNPPDKTPVTPPPIGDAKTPDNTDSNPDPNTQHHPHPVAAESPHGAAFRTLILLLALAAACLFLFFAGRFVTKHRL